MDKKLIAGVFGLLGILVACVLIWALVFNDGGFIKTGWNAIANGINGQFSKVAGEVKFLPTWDEAGVGEGENYDYDDADVDMAAE